MTKILTVTADDEFAAACATALPEHDDIQVVSATSVEEAIDILERQTQIECIVSDHDLPDTNGIAFLEAVRAQTPTLPFILFTTEGSEMVASRAISAGVTDYLIKERHKNQWEQLAALIRNAVRYYRDQSGIVNTEERAKTLLNAANDIIAVVRDGTVAYLNETGMSYVHHDAQDETSTGSVSDFLVADATTPIDDLLAAVQSGSETLDHRDGKLITAEGTRVPVEITATRVTWTETPAVVLILRDVSEQEDQANELRLTNQVIDEAPIGITIADATQSNTPVIYANDKFHELTGYEEDDILGQGFQFLQGENTNPGKMAEIRDAADAEESVAVELRNYRADDTVFWNRMTIAPITNDTGEVTHYVGFQEDVTERVEYEQMLRRFQRAVEAAGHAIYITDPDSVITYANPAFERITGYDSNEIVGQNPRVLKSGEMSTTYYNRLWATISRGHVWEEEIRDQKKSGELYYAHQTIAPLTRSNGDIEAYVAIQQDITDRKEDEFQLRQYERAIEGADELIAAIDHERHYLFANEAYREFHSLDSGSLTEMTLADAIGTETYETVEPKIERALDGETVQYRMTRSRSHRSDRVFDIRYYPLTDDTGHVEGVVATMRDLTDQVEREQHLTSLDRMLRHNIQNELNLVLGYAQMIDDQAPDEIAELSTMIEESADRILEQANKEREIVELLSDPADPTHLNLEDIVDTVVDEVRGEHPDAKISVEVPTDLQMLSIPEVQRAIEEIVKNAVIHSDNGSSQVQITVIKHEATVEIEVADNGPGIPPNERRVITGDSEIDDVTHSSGMGLWLVKRIVSRIDGDIQFEELDDSGSVVTLLLPFYDA